MKEENKQQGDTAMVDFGYLFYQLVMQTGLLDITLGNVFMIVIGGILLYLGIAKNMSRFC